MQVRKGKLVEGERRRQSDRQTGRQTNKHRDTTNWPRRQTDFLFSAFFSMSVQNTK